MEFPIMMDKNFKNNFAEIQNTTKSCEFVLVLRDP